jgi:AcrR family transcriptional regulator
MAYDPSDAATQEDLTARARIRDAALRLFADRGIDRTSVRDIAKAAGVSAGLIRHHFGSKDALRDACDAHAIDRLLRIKEQSVDEGLLADPAFLPSVQPTKLLLHRYLGRAMVDGSPAAASMFERFVDLAEEWLVENWPDHTTDTRAYAAVLVGSQLGLLVMYDHLVKAMGVDPSSMEGNIRVNRGAVTLHAHALLTPDLVAQAEAAYDRLLPQQPPQRSGASRPKEHKEKNDRGDSRRSSE